MIMMAFSHWNGQHVSSSQPYEKNAQRIHETNGVGKEEEVEVTHETTGFHYSANRVGTDLFWHLILLSVKQGGSKYHFLSLWYDST